MICVLLFRGSHANSEEMSQTRHIYRREQTVSGRKRNAKWKRLKCHVTVSLTLDTPRHFPICFAFAVVMFSVNSPRSCSVWASTSATSSTLQSSEVGGSMGDKLAKHLTVLELAREGIRHRSYDRLLALLDQFDGLQ